MSPMKSPACSVDGGVEPGTHLPPERHPEAETGTLRLRAIRLAWLSDHLVPGSGTSREIPHHLGVGVELHFEIEMAISRAGRAGVWPCA
jgi:hypothetical protein